MVTTLATFGKYDVELVCYAHSKGARVVLKGTFLPLHFFQVSEGRLKHQLLNMFLFPRFCHCWREGDVPLSYIVDQENRTAWINEKVKLAKTQFMDGINIDIEQAVAGGSPEYRALTALVKETTEAFHREIPGSQVRDSFF